MAAGIPGVEIFSQKLACVVYFNMQNSNFMAAPKSETFGFALLITGQKLLKMYKSAMLAQAAVRC